MLQACKACILDVILFLPQSGRLHKITENIAGNLEIPQPVYQL